MRCGDVSCLFVGVSACSDGEGGWGGRYFGLWRLCGRWGYCVWVWAWCGERRRDGVCCGEGRGEEELGDTGTVEWLIGECFDFDFICFDFALCEIPILQSCGIESTVVR